MKKLFIILSAAVLLTACLGEEPRTELPLEDVITDASSLYSNTVSTLYNYIGGYVAGEGLQGTYRGVYDLQTFTTDEAIIPTRGGDWYDGGLWQELFLHTYTDDNEVIENAWKYLYKVVMLTNRSLSIIDDYQELLSNEQYLAYTAEVKALRAMYYYYLIDLFGDVPLVQSVDMSVYDIYCSPRETVFNFIISELENSLPYLSDDRSQKLGAYYGHVTKAVAYFIMMKMYLNSEVWTGTARWEKVEEMAGYIEGLGYKLDDKQSDCFAVHNEYSTENIFTIPMDKVLYRNQFWNQFRSLHYQHGSALGYGGENGACATIETLNTFGYQTETLDSRFQTTFFADTVYNLDNEPLTLTDGTILVYHPLEVKLDLTTSPYIITAGARMRKYEHDPTAVSDGKLRSTDIVLFRYADVLLMVAEAKVRQGKDGAAEFNKVRARSAVAERECTLENIYEERKLELMWEGWRRQDMIRFGTYCNALHDRPQISDSKVVFPIPQAVKDMNPNL